MRFGPDRIMDGGGRSEGQGKIARGSRSRRLLDLSQLLELRFARVVLIERIAAADQPVSWRGGAITERTADELGSESAFLNGVGENVRIGQRHPAEADQVGPP